MQNSAWFTKGVNTSLEILIASFPGSLFQVIVSVVSVNLVVGFNFLVHHSLWTFPSTSCFRIPKKIWRSHSYQVHQKNKWRLDPYGSQRIFLVHVDESVEDWFVVELNLWEIDQSFAKKRIRFKFIVIPHSHLQTGIKKFISEEMDLSTVKLMYLLTGLSRHLLVVLH